MKFNCEKDNCQMIVIIVSSLLATCLLTLFLIYLCTRNRKSSVTQLTLDEDDVP